MKQKKLWALALVTVLAMLLALSACAGDPDASSVSPAPSESESASTMTDAGDTSSQPDESQPAGDEGAASTPDVEGEPEKEPEPTPEQTPEAEPEKEPEAEPEKEPEAEPSPKVTPTPEVTPVPEVTPAPEASETIPPAHTHEYKDTVVAPTCEKGGYTVHTCDCGHSYSDKETKATGHSYTDKVIAPTTSAQGYTLHTCGKCGTSYKDSYVDKLPAEKPADPKPTQPSTPGDTGYEEGGWKGDDYGSGEKIEGNEQIAGQFVDHKGYSRKFYTDGMTAADARTALNSYVGYVYGRRFFSDGISINDADKGKFAKIVAHEDGRLGVNVFGWRKSYDSNVVQNSCINMVMEAFYFFTKDRDVAYSLFNVVDYMSINGAAATTAPVVEGFGFTCSNETSNGIDLTMNGILIRWEWGGGNNFYFG